jgi:hypothetical protein
MWNEGDRRVENERPLRQYDSRDSVPQKEISELLRFLPRFEESVEPVSEWAVEDKSGDGSVVAPYPIYSRDVVCFFSLAGESCWADYDYDPSEARRLLEDEQAIAQADVSEIKTMLTYCVRGERFCPGHWGEMIRSGAVTAILRRLAELTDGNGSTQETATGPREVSRRTERSVNA